MRIAEAERAGEQNAAKEKAVGETAIASLATESVIGS